MSLFALGYVIEKKNLWALAQSIWSYFEQAAVFWWSKEKIRKERRGEERESGKRIFDSVSGREGEKSSLRPLISKCLLLRIASPLHLL